MQLMDRDIIEALIREVEVKDACTAAHTWRVALYTQLLSEAGGLDRNEVLRPCCLETQPT